MLPIIRYICIYTTLFLMITQHAFASAEGARDFVKNLSDKTLTIVTSEITMDEKKTQLDELFRTSVDTQWIARFVMGRYWRKATTSQRNEYTQLYTQFLINSYVPKFKEYTNQKFVLKKYLAEEENEYLIQTEIVSENAAPIRVDYRIRQHDNGQYTVFDIVAEGISLITTQRSEFGSILSRNGIDFLIQKLGTRI